MTKVILDFQNLIEGLENEQHFQAMMELAKEAKGFYFFISRGNSGGHQICNLDAAELAAMIDTIEKGHPEIGLIRMIARGSNPFKP